MRKYPWTDTGLIGGTHFEDNQARLLKQRLKQEEDQHTDAGPPGLPAEVCPSGWRQELQKRRAKLDKALRDLGIQVDDECEDPDCDDEGHEWEIVEGRWCCDHVPQPENVPQEWSIDYDY